MLVLGLPMEDSIMDAIFRLLFSGVTRCGPVFRSGWETKPPGCEYDRPVGPYRFQTPSRIFSVDSLGILACGFPPIDLQRNVEDRRVAKNNR